MNFGAPHAAGFGSAQNHLKRDAIQPSANGRPHRVFLQAAPAFEGGIWGIYLNSLQVDTISLPDSTYYGPVFVPASGGLDSLQFLRQGHSSAVDLSCVARAMQVDTSPRVTLSWLWPSEFLGASVPASWLSAWVFSSVPSTLINMDQNLPYRGSWEYSLSVVAGVAFIAVTSGATAICSGSGAVGTTVDLVDAGNGISGTVLVNGSAVDEAGDLVWRWPAAMKVYRGTVLQATVANPMDGRAATWAEPDDLAAGAYSYTLATLSDFGVVGTPGSPIVVNLNTVPLPASNLHYTSGAAAALVVGWTASPTTGASYNLYVQGIADDFMDLNAPTAISAGVVTATLPAQTGYPGVVRVLLRAEKSGVEEAQGQLIEIELDGAGGRVAPRPNTPFFGPYSVAGAALTVNALYITAYQAATPTSIQLFKRTPTGSYDFVSPIATAALSAGVNFRTAVLSATLTPGTYYLTLRSITAGGVLSESYPDEIQVIADTSAITAPTFSAQAARS